MNAICAFTRVNDRLLVLNALLDFLAAIRCAVIARLATRKAAPHHHHSKTSTWRKRAMRKRQPNLRPIHQRVASTRAAPIQYTAMSRSMVFTARSQ